MGSHPSTIWTGPLKNRKWRISCTLPLDPIYVITPTYDRPAQRAELTRVSQALTGVESLVWIVVEDANNFTDKVSHFLRQVSPIHSGMWRSNFLQENKHQPLLT